MAADNDYFDSDDIADGSSASMADCAGALGGGTFKGAQMTPAQIGDIITKGADGATDGLAAIDPADVEDYDEDKYNDAVGSIGAGVVAALDDINRKGVVPINLDDFIAIKDSTTTSIVAYGTAKGTSKWGNSGGGSGGGIKGKICDKELDSIKNVTSIPGFDPVTAIGNFFCSLFSKEIPCGLFASGATNHEICTWNAVTASCEKKSAVNICYLVSVRVFALRFPMNEFFHIWHCSACLLPNYVLRHTITTPLSLDLRTASTPS